MKRGLGRGLDSLFAFTEDDDEQVNEVGNTKEEIETSREKEVRVIKEDSLGNRILELDLNCIFPNENQPRKNFEETPLLELANSIKVHGVIQPIIVSKEKDGRYMIIAGERRWRASILAQKNTIPAIIKDYTEKQIAEVSLIENLQREDLNPIEAARAMKKLMEEYHFTQEQIADKIGKSRPVVANLMRLLNLYPEVMKMVENNELSVGHAKCLVVVDDTQTQLKFANMAKNNKITVRVLEKMVRNYLNPKAKNNDKESQSIELKEMVNEMSRVFSTKVSVLGNDNKGRIYIDYYTKDDLNRIYEMLNIIKEKQLTLKDLQNINKIKK